MQQKREKKVIHPELGTVNVCFNPRAIRYILKVKDGEVYATVPPKGDEKTLWDFIETSKPNLLTMLANRPKLILNEETQLQTHTFKLKIQRCERSNFYCTIKEHILLISCPINTLFEKECTQRILQELLAKSLRHEAKRILPQKIHQLAKLHGFTINNVTIKGNSTSWGSCSSNKNINLSYQILLLPAHLIDYILLHELCHTVEMNHSIDFWNLLDRVCGGRNAEYKNELKRQRMLVI